MNANINSETLATISSYLLKVIEYITFDIALTNQIIQLEIAIFSKFFVFTNLYNYGKYEVYVHIVTIHIVICNM